MGGWFHPFRPIYPERVHQGQGIVVLKRGVQPKMAPQILAIFGLPFWVRVPFSGGLYLGPVVPFVGGWKLADQKVSEELE